jgi:uncharacterized protein YkwD
MRDLRSLRTVATGLAVMVVAATLSVTGLVTTPPALATWDAETATFLTLINAYRAQQNPPAPAVQLDATLQQAADWHANDQLVTANCTAPGGPPCSHTDSTRRSARSRITGAPPTGFGYSGIWGGENMCWDVSGAQAVLDCWKNSSVHNANMLNPAYAAIGIARQCNAAGVCMWVTVHGNAVITPFTPPTTGSDQATQSAAAMLGTGTWKGLALHGTAQPPAAPSWTGTWETDFGTLALAQTGDQVTGTYAYISAVSGGAVNGSLTGAVTGDSLSGTWTATPSGPPFDSGTFRFVLAGDGGSFEGNIVYANGEADIWDGARPH